MKRLALISIPLAALMGFFLWSSPSEPEPQFGATTVFSDTFTTGADTDLELHAPNVGTSWTMLWQTASTAKITDIAATGRARANAAQSNSGVMYTADATYTNPDYYVQATASAGCTGSNRCYLFVRMADQENMYALRFTTDVTQTRMWKKVGGTWTALTANVADPAVGTVVRLEVIGTNLTFYYNGVSQSTISDSDLAAAGKAGLGMGGGTELVASTDDMLGTSAFDDFSVVDTTVAGGGAVVTTGDAIFFE
jgi:hypothetical protein